MNDPRVQEAQKVKHRQPYVPISVTYQHIQVVVRSTSPDMTTLFHAKPSGTFIETKSKLRKKKLQKANQGSFSLEVVLVIETI